MEEKVPLSAESLQQENERLRGENALLRTRLAGMKAKGAEHLHLQTELKQYREHLEKLVEARTAELEKANAGLKTEIGERKKLEETLRYNEGKYRAIFESANHGIFQSTPEGRYISVNPSFARMFGYQSPQEMVETVQNIGDELYCNPDERKRLSRILAEHGSVEQFEIHGRRRDGSEIWISANVQAIRLPDGTVSYYEGTSVDITERRQAEEELKFRTAILATQQQASINGVLMVDQDGRMISFNQRFVDMWEIPPGIAKSQSDERALEHVVGKLANPGEFLQKVRHLYENRAEKSHDEVHLSDGRIFDRYSAPIWSTDGDYYGRVWYFHDITELKNTEVALKRSEAQLRQIIDLVPHLIFIKDWDGRFVLVNKAWSEHYMSAASEIMGKHHGEIHPDHAEVAQMLADDREVMSSGEIKVVPEEIFTNARGRKVLLHITKVPFTLLEDNIPAVLGVGIDITEQKQAERSLKESEARLREAQAIAHMGSWSLDIATDLVTWSEELYTITGRNPALPAPRRDDHAAFMTAQSWERYRKISQETLETGEPFEVELEQVLPDGTSRWVVNRGTAVRDSEGRITRLAGTVQDITERKRAREALQQALNDVEDHNRRLEASTLALRAAINDKNLEIAERRRVEHDLHLLTQRLHHVREEERTSIAREIHDELGQQLTALRFIVADLRELLSEKEPPFTGELDSMMELLKLMIHSVKRICSELRPMVLDDLGFTDALISLSGDFQKRTGIRCSCHFPRGAVDLDRNVSTHLYRICQEALTNAARHSGAKEVKIRVRKKDNHLEMIVRDNGIGIAEKNSPNHLSLGLLGIRERVHLLGGEVAVRGCANKGTTVRVILPLHAKE